MFQVKSSCLLRSRARALRPEDTATIPNEPDDEQSLVRFLVYSNEFDVDGLVATASTWLRNKTREDIIRRFIGAYGEVRPNLLKHAPGYPTTDQVLAVTSTAQPGFGLAFVGKDKTSASGHDPDPSLQGPTRAGTRA
jgi:hypothetical protein